MTQVLLPEINRVIVKNEEEIGGRSNEIKKI